MLTLTNIYRRKHTPSITTNNKVWSKINSKRKAFLSQIFHYTYNSCTHCVYTKTLRADWQPNSTQSENNPHTQTDSADHGSLTPQVTVNTHLNWSKLKQSCKIPRMLPPSPLSSVKGLPNSLWHLNATMLNIRDTHHMTPWPLTSSSHKHPFMSEWGRKCYRKKRNLNF